MGNKKDQGAGPVTCGTCGVETNGIKGKDHRRCGGSSGASIREKHKKLEGAKRGTWN
jgi:hypothetical protein